MSKREREESDASAAVADLEAATLQGASDPKQKLKALDALRKLIDADDEQYDAQKEMGSAGAVGLLVELIDESHEAVSVEAIQTLTAITQHSPAALARLQVGQDFVMGQDDKVSFNPVQADVADTEALAKLVGLYFEGSEPQQDAAFTALRALEAFNRPNKLAVLHELVKRLVAGNTQALVLMDTLLDGLDFHDDVAVILDQAQSAIIDLLSTGDAGVKREAVALLGTIAAKRPGARDFLISEGALKPVVQLLLKGDLETKDAAVHALWLLVKDKGKVLRPEAGALGAAGSQLVAPLWDIIDHGVKPKENGEANGAGDEGSDGTTDNSEEAMSLLKALAAQDRDVKAKVKNTSASGTSCTIM